MNHKIQILNKSSSVRDKYGSLIIYYAEGESPFGKCFLAMTDKGICALSFVNADINTKIPAHPDPVEALERKWPEAMLKKDPVGVCGVIKKIFYPVPGSEPEKFDIVVKGTDFQLSVWNALLSIVPEGRLVSYSDVAAAAGNPRAVRAAAGAVAANPVSYLIPCHRVILKNGSIHRYGGGVERKRAIIRQEAGSS